MGLAMVTCGFLLGLAHAWEKLTWLPAQLFELLGLEWDTVRLTRSLSRARVHKLQQQAASLRSTYDTGGTTTIRNLARFQGGLRAAKEGSRQAALYAVPINNYITLQLRRHGGDYDARVHLNIDWLDSIDWVLNWSDWELWSWMRANPVSIVVCTDASEYGIGMHEHPLPPKGYSQRRHLRATERTLHHNIQEGIAAIEGQQGIVQFYNLQGEPGNPLTIGNETDNTMIEKLIAKGSCRSAEACRRLRAHYDFLDARLLQAVPIFQSGQTMETARTSDALSRRKSRWYEWSLPTSTVKTITLQCGLNPELGIDLYAEHANAQFPRFVSLEPHTDAMWMDAMSRNWSYTSNPLINERDWLWIFPPPRQLPRIVTHLTNPHHPPVSQAMLIVPDQRWQPWHQALRNLEARPPIPAGNWRNCIPPEGHHDRDKRTTPPNWPLIAILISIQHDKPAATSASQ